MSLRHEAKIKELEKRADDQDDVIAALWKRIEDLEEKADRRPGRPKKVANG